MATVSQFSFAGGEIAPALYGRVDTVKYATGLAKCRNFFVMRHGGVASRPGTKFIAEVKDSTKETALIPFVINADQTYVLEFGEGYIRFIKNGAQVTDLNLTITGITKANPGVVTYTGTDPTVGDEVYISGVVGMTELNNRNFKVGTVNTSSNTFQLKDMTNTNFNTTSLTTYVSGGTASRIYEIDSPYQEEDLVGLQLVESANDNLATIVHKLYAPRELKRISDTSWTLSTITFGPSINGPTNIIDTGRGENPSSLTLTITNVTGADIGVVTYTGTDPSNGNVVYISGVSGMTVLNGRNFRVAAVNKTDNKFDLQDLAGNNYSTENTESYTSGGTAVRVNYKWKVTSVSDTNEESLPIGYAESSTNPEITAVTLNWDAVSGINEYYVYREINGIYGFIGSSGETSFIDTGIVPDILDTPPIEREPFDGTGNYPSTVSRIQQRICFANSTNAPETIYMSQIDRPHNFCVSSPLQDDDAVTFAMSGRYANEVKHIIDIGVMVVFTSSGEWLISGDGSGIITPSQVNPKQYSYYGSSDISPIIIGNTALYVQARGTIVRDLAYELVADQYSGNDLTIFSAHLFDGYSIVDWGYQQIPHSIVWAVRNDGSLLGLTYLKEQQILAWHKHDFEGGLVKNICVIPEGTTDSAYLLIERTINGRTVQYIESMADRRIDDIVDYVGLDCSLSYDGRNTSTSHTMTLSGGTDWDDQEFITLTSSASYFSSSDVGNKIHITGSDDTLIRFEITAYTSATVVTGKTDRTIPTTMRTTAISDWAKAVDEISGLWHLEGQTVSILGDGFVIASKNNPAYEVFTVASGKVTLPECYSVIHIGLPITCDLQTLDINSPEQTLIDEFKNISKVNVLVEKSRGIWVSGEEPEDDSLDGFRELKIRQEESYDEPVSLKTGVIDVTIQSQWNSNGRVFIRQTDPVPLSILSVAPSGMFG